jgi:2-polyprenyl-3-methyl-5-hydroxy-6-metoxy-1,4-benzoquinol methylase
VIYPHVAQYPDASIVQCEQCHHIYSLFKRDIDTTSLYNEGVYKIVENRNTIFDKILSFEYRRVVKKIDTTKSTKGSLLDFGCGKGKFASLAKQDGWDVKCVETSSERASYAKTVYGLEVNTDFYVSGNIFQLRFDALTLFHVLEHLPSATALLKELISANLDDEGLVVIEVPNFESLQSSIAGNKWMHLDPPRHLSHFTPKRLEIFMGSLALTPIHKQFFSFHLGVLGMADSLLKKLGYKSNIIFELKNRKSIFLLVKLAVVLPFALILEYFAAISGKGGIIRLYLKRQNPTQSD